MIPGNECFPIRASVFLFKSGQNHPCPLPRVIKSLPLSPLVGACSYGKDSAYFTLKLGAITLFFRCNLVKSLNHQVLTRQFKK